MCVCVCVSVRECILMRDDGTMTALSVDETPTACKNCTEAIKGTYIFAHRHTRTHLQPHKCEHTHTNVM